MRREEREQIIKEETLDPISSLRNQLKANRDFQWW